MKLRFTASFPELIFGDFEKDSQTPRTESIFSSNYNHNELKPHS